MTLINHSLGIPLIEIWCSAEKRKCPLPPPLRKHYEKQFLKHMMFRKCYVKKLHMQFFCNSVYRKKKKYWNFKLAEQEDFSEVC